MQGVFIQIRLVWLSAVNTSVLATAIGSNSLQVDKSKDYTQTIR